jgi:uncharacterized protein (TIGR03083 family)
MPGEPILISEDLFHDLNNHLVVLLQSLEPREWDLPTVCEGWCVKDLAAHLLHGMLRRLSLQRDGYDSPRTAERFGSPVTDLVSFLRKSNQAWTTGVDGLSPQVLIGLLNWAEPQVNAFFSGLDPDEPARFPVSWAGENQSPNWMDIAREYTERWNHHRQIVEAVGRGHAIEQAVFYHPVLDIYMRALPCALAHIIRPSGTRARVVVAGNTSGRWDVVADGTAWRLAPTTDAAPGAQVTLPTAAAWLVLTKRWPIATFLQRWPQIRLEGDRQLAEAVLGTVAMVA